MLLHKSGSSKADNLQQSVDNSAKTLLANIRFMSVDNPVRTVVMTSAIPNEGKTFVAANLARAMATSGIRTLLVECDMRRRSMSHTLHVHAQRGLYAVMSGEAELLDAVIPTGTPRLHFLDAEPHIPNPSDLLNSRRFTALIEEAKKEFGYIIFDTPPVGTFVDAAVLGAKADAVFMVVREQYTRKDEIARAADQLKTANVRLSGIVMNFCERQSNEYYYDYYYREDRPKERAEDKLVRSARGLFGRGGEPVREPAPKADGEPREERASAPRSWNNAPDLGDGDSVTVTAEYNQNVADSAEDTGNLSRVRSQRQRRTRASIPMLGQTGIIQRSDLDARIRSDESNS